MAAYDSLVAQAGFDTSTILIVVFIALAWKFFWYGLALFKAIEKKDKNWFVALIMGAVLLSFFVNDLGILAIIYLILEKRKTRKRKK
jgi:hypothetical protein